MRFRDALEGYWLENRLAFSQNTVNDYSLTFRRFEEMVGDRPVSEIGADDVRRFLYQLAEMGLGDKSRANAWTALSSFWSWAEVELDIPHVIRGRVKRPRYSRKRIVPYAEDEVVLMIKACDLTDTWRSSTGRLVQSKRPTAERDRLMIIVLLDTGVRASELCNLELRDYDNGDGRLTVRHGKGDKERDVYLGARGQKALWKYLLKRKGDPGSAPLFPSRSGAALERNNLRKTLQRIGRRAGVAGVTVHRFRHTFAINFLRNGGNVLALQELLGHEKLDTVRIYARLAEVDLRRAQQAASPADGWGL